MQLCGMHGCGLCTCSMYTHMYSGWRAEHPGNRHPNPPSCAVQVVQPPAERLPGALRTHQREVAAAAALSSSGVIAALLDEFTEPGMLCTVVSSNGATNQPTCAASLRVVWARLRAACSAPSWTKPTCNILPYTHLPTALLYPAAVGAGGGHGPSGLPQLTRRHAGRGGGGAPVCPARARHAAHPRGGPGAPR